MAITAVKFLECVRASGLLETEALDRALAAIQKSAAAAQLESSEFLAAQLVEAGLLTRWQCDTLLKGKHKGFFLGKYKLLSHLGTGGMSSVYLAEHTTMLRRAAIKVLPASRVDDSSYLARFKLEARAAAALDHPNIVRVYDIDNDGPLHYIVMEYVEGSDLQHIVKDNGPLAYERAADYVMQAASGLDHAHAAGFVHRDIKPANLLVDPRGVVKVLDMGLAKFGDEKLASLTIAHDENVLGTADYLPPEQAINSHAVDCRADIYSLGCTLYFLLTGHPPFPDGTLPQRLMMHQTKMPPSILNDRPNAPTPLVDICMKMIAKRADDRPQTAGEIVEFLKSWLAGGPAPSATASGAAPVVGRPGRTRGTDPSRVAVAGDRGRSTRGGDSGSSAGSVHPTGGSKSLNDTIADGTRLDTIKGPGKSLPARGGDSSKSRKGPAPLPMAKSIDDNPFSFVEEQRAGRPRSDPSTSGASRGSSKDRKAVASEPAEATPAPDRVKEPRRSGIGRRAAADSAKKDNAKKDSAKKDSAKRGETAAAPVDGARPRTRSRGKGGELPQWLWAVVAVAFVVSLLVVGYCVYKLSNPPPVATQPPAKTAKSKDGKHAKDSVDAKAAPAAPAANPAAVNAEALKLDATKQDASKPAAAK